MTWEEIIAAAEAAGFLKFQADGVAVLQRPVKEGAAQ